jgi:hypothetical protein
MRRTRQASAKLNRNKTCSDSVILGEFPLTPNLRIGSDVLSVWPHLAADKLLNPGLRAQRP